MKLLLLFFIEIAILHVHFVRGPSNPTKDTRSAIAISSALLEKRFLWKLIDENSAASASAD
jgi:hypothetical protein